MEESTVGKRPIILSIAGFDPSSGAGITSDVKTAENIGVYALGVISGITIQNESEFENVTWTSVRDIALQINILKQKHDIEFVKIGLIEDIHLIKTIIQFLPNSKIIWDPVLKATAGFRFHNQLNKLALKKIAKYCYLMTPNIPEWEKMGSCIAGKTNILIKGGHAGDHANDTLLLKDGTEILIEGDRLEGAVVKHGSGCVLATAITSYLAQGFELVEACRKAKEYTKKFLLSTDSLLGIHS